MIGRIWHGWTHPDNASEYQRVVSTEVLPAIAARNIPGYRGANLMRRELDQEVEFITIMWFDSLENVKDFMGEDYEVSHVPEQAQAVLSRFDTRSQHYDIILAPQDTGGAKIV